MKHFLIFIICVLSLSACHKDKHEETTPKPDSLPANMTLLVYLAGDNNLDDNYYDYEEGRTINFVDEDISQMMKGSSQLTSKQHLILFVDRKGEKPYFLHIANGDTTRMYTYDTELKSSDAATLAMALRWVKENYPADSYGLSLWGHADGWTISKARTTQHAAAPRKAYGQDTTNGTMWMEIPDMAKALKEVCGDQPLRFIFADCCCFQCVESAYELRKVTDYIIASPAEIPGEGAPYDMVIPALFDSSDKFYEAAADAYHAQTSYGYGEPLSVVKTSELENLAQATKAALTQCVEPLNSNGTNYPKLDSLIYYYNHCLYDMNDFMLLNATTDAYILWKKSFDKAVPWKKMATVWMSSGGYYYDERHVPFTNSSETQFRDFKVTEERYGGISMFSPQNTSTLLARDKQYQEKQRKNISQMQWFTAAGYDVLGW